MSRDKRDELRYFPSDYREAHQRFCEDVHALGWEIELSEVVESAESEESSVPADALDHPAKTQDASQLAVAAAISPQVTNPQTQAHVEGELAKGEIAQRTEESKGRPSHALSSPGTDRVLVISSGLHGVEGYFGTAVLLQALDRWRRLGPPDVRVVLLHALNPYGYANLRRVDERNVDLNRNFLLKGESYVGSPTLYSRLDRFLNPRQGWQSDLAFYSGAVLRVMRHGMPRVREAIAGGQYDFPKGLFYGGESPSKQADWLAERLPVWLQGAKRVVHLDFHTGLGRWATYQLLIESEMSPAQRQSIGSAFAAEQWVELFPPNRCDSPKSMYRARGSFGRWCEEQLRRSSQTSELNGYLFAVAEFGTYPPLRILKALRRENAAYQAWKASKPSLPNETDCDDQTTGNQTKDGRMKKASMQQEKKRLLEAFCPSSEQWRQKVLVGAAEVVERMLKLLEESSA